MADKNGEQQPQSLPDPEKDPSDKESPGPRKDPSDEQSPDPKKDPSDEEGKGRGPNWAAGSFLLNLWRVLHQALSDEDPPSSGPPFL